MGAKWRLWGRRWANSFGKERILQSLRETRGAAKETRTFRIVSTSRIKRVPPATLGDLLINIVALLEIIDED